MKKWRLCGLCHKRRYATEEAATADVARIAAFSSAPKVPVRVYQCDAGWWHATSQETPWWETAAITEKTGDTAA